MSDNSIELLLVADVNDGQKRILKKLWSLGCDLYLTNINTLESYVILTPRFSNQTCIILWHKQHGHPNIFMLRHIIIQSTGHLMDRDLSLLYSMHFDLLSILCKSQSWSTSVFWVYSWGHMWTYRPT